MRVLGDWYWVLDAGRWSGTNVVGEGADGHGHDGGRGGGGRGAGSWMVRCGCWLLGTGRWAVVGAGAAGQWRRRRGCWVVDVALWVVGAGCWVMGTGRWAVVCERCWALAAAEMISNHFSDELLLGSPQRCRSRIPNGHKVRASRNAVAVGAARRASTASKRSALSSPTPTAPSWKPPRDSAGHAGEQRQLDSRSGRTLSRPKTPPRPHRTWTRRPQTRQVARRERACRPSAGSPRRAMRRATRRTETRRASRTL